MNEKYNGTTVNERLYLSGLTYDFDKAVKNKEIDKIICILKEIELSDQNINQILKYYNLI